MHLGSLSVQTEEKKWKWVQRQNHTEYQIGWITLFETFMTLTSHLGSYVLDSHEDAVVQRTGLFRIGLTYLSLKIL